VSKRSAFGFGLHRPDKAAAEMDAELAFHIEETAKRLEAKGLRPEDARAEAIRRLGNVAPLQHSNQHKERTLRMRDLIDDFIDDLRYAARNLARRPAFTAVAVATLAIGIGANTAIYTAVDAMLYRALPFREPDRLMDIVLMSPGEGATRWSWSKVGTFRDAQQSFSSWGLYSSGPGILTGENPERISVEEVSARYLQTLGVPVARGADFAPEIDNGPGAAKQVILTDVLWQRRFSADPDIVGKLVSIDNVSWQIIGVTPPGFRGLDGNTGLLMPITARDADGLSGAWSLEFSMIGRLKPGVTAEQGTAELRRLGPRIYSEHPMEPGTRTSAKSVNWSADARPLDSIRVAAGLRRSLLVLFGAVGLVLLIACVNIANLLLARAMARRREIAVRLAIGATRGRLVRQLLAESLALSLVGGVASLAVAWWATGLLQTMNPGDSLQAQALQGGIGVVAFEGIHLNGGAMVFAFATTLLVGIAFGLVPAFGATRGDLTRGLKDDGSGIADRRTGWRLGVNRRALVISEVALSIVLLAASGLATRSLINLLHVDAGIDPANVLTLRLRVPGGGVAPDSMPGFYDAVQARLAALPGVTGVAFSDCPPLSGGCNGTIMTFADRPRSATGNAVVGVHWVSGNFFQTMGVPLRDGRVFEPTDRRGNERVVVINEAAVKKYFPNESPIGKRVAVYQGGFDKGATIVGVVGDVRFETLDGQVSPDVFIAYTQSTLRRAMVVLRTAVDPMSIVPSVRAAMKEVAPGTPIFEIRTMESRVAAASGQARLSATLLASFAVLALALAVMGVYGVMSFAVEQRTREIGIRVAMGADRSSVVRLFTREGLALGGAGVAIGLVGAFAATRVMRGLLYGVAPDDLTTFATIVVVVFVATLLASWIPARRASSLDPVRALR
jgi:putative ABC transport system permease protein